MKPKQGRNSSKLLKDQQSLEVYYDQVMRIILARQHPASGLIPASVAVTSHGDYRDAWVRDNVYSILAVWGLALAYRRLDDDQGRAYELEHATIKCMRGLLFAMMKQASKVELFKSTQNLGHALHAKYNTATGDTVVADNAWGHLQLDATAIFLLFLAQMTVSGLHIIYTTDEVQFIQNLVFYIERAYRTPDYGVWERGNKINHGQPELNCSSIGMCVAALQAVNGINLFGSRGGPSSVIHVLPDEIARNYTTLHSALPRESPSKEIDAALLAVISFPAFAVGDLDLIERTRRDIIKKLGGRYGCKRFLRDGHQTVVEDHGRLHYEPHELKIFEGIESEWPLFFTYLVLDGLFLNKPDQVSHYSDLLDETLVDSNTIDLYSKAVTVHNGYDSEDEPEPMLLVPELYILPAESIEAERKNHGSQERVPNQNIPLVWAQSLHIMGNLIKDGLLSVADVDPLGRRLAPSSSRNNVDTVVQIVLLAETEELQSKLLMYGLETFTLQNCEPITISKPSCLRDAYTFLGKNAKLGLSGRPNRPMGTLSTCKIYRCQGQLYAFYPHFMDREEFYLVSDNDYLVSLFEQEISSVRNHWMQTGRPTMVVMLTKQMFGNIDAVDIPSGGTNIVKRNLLNFFISIGSSGICNGTRVRVGRLSEMINTACVESLDFLASYGSEGVTEDWGFILSGKQRLRDNIENLKTPEPDERNRHEYFMQLKTKIRSIRTVNTPLDEDDVLCLPMKSPLVHSLINESDLDEFELGGAEPKSRRTASPTREDPINLALGNPAQTKQAIDMLFTCTNMLDQIDLLHYLYSCHGLDYVVSGLASINVLLEEVYWKAMHAKEWSIVRHAAGILKKTVNSLTSNLADLLVRQKPVTIGVRPNEYFIDSPKNPAALAAIIFEHCNSDIREAPLVQEVITYLGQLVRSSPAVFSGIMRIRTHFFIIAMREEISRSMRCDEEEAIEKLMMLSPYEMKSLLQQVLIAHDQVEAFKITNNAPVPPARGRGFTLGGKAKIQSKEGGFSNELMVTVQSGGFSAGNFAELQVFNNGVPVTHPLIPGRGLNMVVVSPYDGSIHMTAHFDTNFSKNEAEHLATHIMTLDTGFIVLMAGKDDFIANMTESALKAIESLGSSLIRNVHYRDSWCIIGEKGAEIGSVPEFYRSAHLGPTEKISKVYNLVELRKIGVDRRGSYPAKDYLPSDGWWLRRRRNDGALNRVPTNFYPKVWRLLSKTNGIQIGNVILKSNPTISESTPEELNFALQVENLLDNFTDPAEHQIAVECLVVISRIEDRNPELTLIGSYIDLRFLIKQAIQSFWNKWISEQNHQTVVTPFIAKSMQQVIEKASNTPITIQPTTIPKQVSPIGISHVEALSREIGDLPVGKTDNPLLSNLEALPITTEARQGSDLSFERNDRLARRIFYDLWQDGPEGTMSYLATACVKNAFGVNWSSEKTQEVSGKILNLVCTSE